MESRLLAEDLLEYMRKLGGILADRGATRLAEVVEFAMHFAIGSTTEFCGESREALLKVRATGYAVLTHDELHELERIISGIDYEFRLIGGA